MSTPSSVAAIISSSGAVARQKADVRHPDHRDPVEAIGPDRAATRNAGDGARVAAREDADPDPVPNDVDRMGRGALVVEAEAAERAFEGRVGRDVHPIGAESK